MSEHFIELDPDYEPGPHGHPPDERDTPVPRGHRHDPSALATVLCGGFLGTLARYELGLAWTTGPRSFPFTIFVINASGAFLLGALLAWPRVGHYRGGLLRRFLGTGVLGGWTTYSSLVVGALTLGHHHEVILGVAYLVATVVVGLAATALGSALQRRVAQLPVRP